MDIALKTLLLFGILVLITQTLGWRAFKVEFQNERLELFHPEIIDINMTIRSKTFVDLRYNILQDLSGLFVDFEDLHDSGGGTYDMVFMNRTIDICAFLNNRKSNPIFDIVHRMFLDYGDLPNRCPIRRKRYELLNVFLNPNKFPPFMPDHKAKVSAVAWNKQHGKKNILLKLSLIVVIERSFKNNRQ